MFRTIFWLGLVIAFIPVNPADLKEGQRPVSPFETLGAMRSVISDMTGFCERNPSTCETGSEIASQFGAKARAGGVYLSALLDNASQAMQSEAKQGETLQPDDSPDTTHTGSIARQ
ncbi:MAG: DUF5330 domain-containing protein [Nitratireductor sp.]|nr:DUF5330 domain-containing protein [Nitratireductor sp.]MCB1449602.1 DUF5330 domain-containing protein [Nitratireductor sp.]